jgi:hypothetical protein
MNGSSFDISGRNRSVHLNSIESSASSSIARHYDSYSAVLSFPGRIAKLSSQKKSRGVFCIHNLTVRIRIDPFALCHHVCRRVAEIS